ncbi:MAG: invasion protein CiaB [Epsilonproteobacteria bacterium]|nr:invasion protein CiaB [Campylobacterota bacterium]
MKNKFYEDLQLIYDEVLKRTKELNRWYEYAKGKEILEAKVTVDKFLDHIGIPVDNKSILAALEYIISLRDDSLYLYMKNLGLREEQIIVKRDLAYIFVSSFYIERFEKLIAWIEANALLTPFYRKLIEGVHLIGISMSHWHRGWNSHVINGINKDLFELFGGDEEEIIKMLREKELLDKRGKEEGDRCYSVLIPDKNGGYKRISYAQAFENEVKEVESALNALIEILSHEYDEVFNAKDSWIEYFSSLKKAFLHKNVDELIELWSEVDRSWMKITTPIQVGHPLEYYEDRYRKSVALEWDLRINNPSLENLGNIKEYILQGAANISDILGIDATKIFNKNLKQFKKTQLYISAPMLFYGSEFQGLFSAQVVPNDEEISMKYGKKIFAYIDYIRESKKAKPIKKIDIKIFGREFIKKNRDLLFNKKEIWNQIYNITTIGHEYGHILWIEEDSETIMNKSGAFKNIEEFKATSGGIIGFFENEKDELIEPLLDEIIYRSISLIGWRKLKEVEPYYCEALITLELLFEAKMIDFEDDFRVIINYDRYDEFKEILKETYISLARSYIKKEDAKLFLNRYTTTFGGDYLPRNQKLKEFVNYYTNLYEKIGGEIAKIEFN